MNEVLEYLKRLNISSDEYIIVATSGGPDSMALIDILVKQNYNVICAHVNHKVRLESESEAKMVEDYCIKNNIIFEYMEINDYSDDNFENEARNKRYTFFDELIKKYNSKYLFTAHHGDDLIETVVMRIVRGTTLKGYSAINRKSMRKEYTIIRPFLSLTKEDLLKYVTDNNIKYAIDKTNFLDDHTRNRYRKYILPALKNEDSKVHLKFLKFSEDMKECNEYIEKVAFKEYERLFLDNYLDVAEYLKLDLIIQKYIMYIILESIYNESLILINSKHVTSLINLIKDNKNNTLNLPLNYKAIKDYNKFYITNIDNNICDYEYIIEDVVELPNAKTIKILENSKETDNSVIYINSSDIKLPIKVRNRRIGDKMNVKNMEGSKKVSDIFIDNKISKLQRDIWPIVIDSNGTILWIPGIKKSKFDSQKIGKYDIILKYS